MNLIFDFDWMRSTRIESTRLDSTGINPTRFNAMQCDLSSVRFEWQNSLFLHPTNTHKHTHTCTVADIHACHTLHIAHSRSGQATQLSSWTIANLCNCSRSYNNYFVSCRSLWLWSLICDCKLVDHKIWHEDAYISLLIEADYKMNIFCQKLKKKIL